MDKIREHAMKEESRYTLVMVAAKRARQIVDGASSKVESRSHKPVTIALDEIAEDKVEFTNPSAGSFK